jgi:hypothetical protein
MVYEVNRSFFRGRDCNMDGEKLAEGQSIQESARSQSATPLNLRYDSNSELAHNSSSSVTRKAKNSFFSCVPEVEEAGAGSQECDRNPMVWNNLEMQLMQATLRDKELSELYLQRMLQKQAYLHSRLHARKKSGSWSTFIFLLLGILPASAFIFALACTVYHIDIQYPQ